MVDRVLLRPGFFEYGEDLVALPFPSSDPAKSVALHAVRSLGVVSNGPRPEDAWLFVRFAAGPAGAALLAQEGYLPACLTEEVVQVWQGLKPLPVTQRFFTTRWTSFAYDLEYLVEQGRLSRATRDAMTGKVPVDEVLKRYAGRQY